MSPTQDQPEAVTGSRVLVTRTADRAAELVGLLRARGAQPILVPVQEAEPVEGDELAALEALLDRAVRAPGHDGRLWLALTSTNTVRALARIARLRHGAGLGVLLGTAGPGALRIASVGPATTRALHDAGVPVDLVPRGASSAEGLLETWAQTRLGGPGRGPGTVLLPQSGAARPRLADGLQDLGWRVERAVAYRMTPWPAEHPLVAAPPGDQPVWTVERARRELAAGGLDAAILTAPSAVRSLAGRQPALLAPLRLVAIGEPTRRAAQHLGLEAEESESTAATDLVAALARALNGSGRSPSSAPG